MLMGSDAQRILLQAECNVLAVKAWEPLAFDTRDHEDARRLPPLFEERANGGHHLHPAHPQAVAHWVGTGTTTIMDK